jgi:DNA-binding PadR family transcriptional regulator
MEKKITKRDNFNAIIEVLTDAGREDLAKVIEHEIELLDNKAAKAKATAAKKKTEGDALSDAVAAVLTDEFCTIADITDKVVFDGEVSTAKVQYRLNDLVKRGIATKEQVTVGEGESKRKLMAYAACVTVTED